jgi:hypothetical protein
LHCFEGGSSLSFGEVGEAEVRIIQLDLPHENPPGHKWVNQWIKEIDSDKNMPDAAKDELLNQAARIAGKIPLPEDIVPGKPTKGLVIGSVQSGKTAVMLGLVAHCLDNGYDVVIILSGNNNPLRQQTGLRFNTNLLSWGERITIDGNIRDTHPKGYGYHGFFTDDDFFAPSHKYESGLISEEISKAASALKKKHKIIVPSIKNSTSIEKFSAGLLKKRIDEENSNESMFRRRGLPYEIKHHNVLIIDDEVDEGTTGATKIAESLPNLFKIHYPELPDPENVRASYVGFTATPQANLYGNENAIFPESFISVLRYSGTYNEQAEKDTEGDEDENFELNHLTTYDSGKPLKGWYCGGYIFHEWLEHNGKDNFLLKDAVGTTTDENDEDLVSTIHFHLVSAAIRLSIERGVFPGEEEEFAEDFKKNSYFVPHSCLIHTSTQTAKHKSTLKKIFDLVAQKAETEPSSTDHDDIFPPQLGYIEKFEDMFTKWLENSEDSWQSVYRDFKDSWDVCDELVPGVLDSEFPEWEVVKTNLARVFAHNKFRLVHDLESGGQVLDFNRGVDVTNNLLPPVDICTIAIGGLLLSRGLTLPGLCTTYLTNSGTTMDTMVQRQRWFGYRGSHLPLCRVFLPKKVRDNFRKRNREDEDLKIILAEFDDAGVEPTDPRVTSTLVSTGKLSGKVPTVHLLGRSGTCPWITFTQLAEDDANLTNENYLKTHQLATKIIDEGVKVPGGWMLGESLFGGIGDESKRYTALEVAEFLESIQYSRWNPDPATERHYKIRIMKSKCADLGIPFDFRPPTGAPSTDAPQGTEPYSLAGYLRMWDNAWKNKNTLRPNVIFDESGVGPWNPIEPPKFNVVLRSTKKSGESQIDISGNKVGMMKRSYSENIAKGRWGGQSYKADANGKVGVWDKWRDWGESKAKLELPDGMKKASRESTDAGLLVIGFIEKSSIKSENSITLGVGHTAYHKPGIGLSIPKGGPVYKSMI